MKKIYIKPEAKVVIILHKLSLLAGSLSIKNGDVSDFNDLLAPELEIDNQINYDVTEY